MQPRFIRQPPAVNSGSSVYGGVVRSSFAPCPVQGIDSSAAAGSLRGPVSTLVRRPIGGSASTATSPISSNGNVSSSLMPNPQRSAPKFQSQGQRASQPVGSQTLTEVPRTSVLDGSCKSTPGLAPSGRSSVGRPGSRDGFSGPSGLGGRSPVAAVNGSGGQPISSNSPSSLVPRELSAASGVSPIAPFENVVSFQEVASDLRNWSNEELRRKIQSLERELGASAASHGMAHGILRSPSSDSLGGRPGQGLDRETARHLGPQIKVGTGSIASSGGGCSVQRENSSQSRGHRGGLDSLEASRLREREFTPEIQSLDSAEALFNLKARQVSELRAQMARNERQLYGGASVDGQRYMGRSKMDGASSDPLGSSVGGQGARLDRSIDPQGVSPTSGTATLLGLGGSLLGSGEKDSGGLPTTGRGDSEPERTGPRSPSPGSACCGSLSLEAELSWIVRQMEAHRRQIQAHQQQLSSLERRHAEIVAAISHRAGSSAHSYPGLRSPTGSSVVGGSTLDGRLGGTGTGTPTDIGTPHSRGLSVGLGEAPSLSEVMTSKREGSSTEVQERQLQQPQPPPQPAPQQQQQQPRLPTAGSPPPDRSSSQDATPPRTQGQEAAPRLQGFSRPGSASSAASGAKPSTVPVPGKYIFQPKVERRPSGQPPPSSLAEAGLAPQGHMLPSDFDSNLSVSSLGTDRGSHFRSKPQLVAASPGLFDKNGEAERIDLLLKELAERRPLRVPFVPMDETGLPLSVGGEGRPFLHGSLEVHVMLSEDGGRLLVRVGSGGAGRLLEIDDFVTRAEAIEARRATRPVPIMEEAESHQSPLTSSEREAATAAAEASAAAAAAAASRRRQHVLPLGGSPSETSSGSPNSSVPWRKLFKSHWSGGGASAGSSGTGTGGFLLGGAFGR